MFIKLYLLIRHLVRIGSGGMGGKNTNWLSAVFGTKNVEFQIFFIFFILNKRRRKKPSNKSSRRSNYNQKYKNIYIYHSFLGKYDFLKVSKKGCFWKFCSWKSDRKTNKNPQAIPNVITDKLNKIRLLKLETQLNNDIRYLARKIENDKNTIESERVKEDKNRMKLRKQNEIIALFYPRVF